jgi:hypothetical protein
LLAGRRRTPKLRRDKSLKGGKFTSDGNRAAWYSKMKELKNI